MMDQTHIGYSGWQEPPKDVMPKLYRVPVRDSDEPPPLPAAQEESPACVAIDASHYGCALDNAGFA
jgi:hypothetical protein